MIPLKLTLGDKVQEVNIADSWEQVTVKQFRAMKRNAEDLNPLRILAILMDVDYELILNLKSSSIDQILLHLSFIGQVPKLEDIKRPEKINIGGLEMKRIVRIEDERLGQQILLSQLMNNAVENKLDKVELINEVLAIYYCDQFHPNKVWDESLKNDVAVMVDDMPIMEAYAEANFFFRKWLRPIKNSPSS